LNHSAVLRPLVALLTTIVVACGGQSTSPSPNSATASSGPLVSVPAYSPPNVPGGPSTGTTPPGTGTSAPSSHKPRPTRASTENPTAVPEPTGPVGSPTPARSFTPNTGLAQQLGAQLQATLDAQQASTGTPGVGAAIAFPDGSIWSAGSGAAIVSPAEPATGDIPFVVGSISKTFVTAAVMQLADAGQLSIDDPLSNWLSDYPNAQNVTLRELLHHTSGIYDYFQNPAYDTDVFHTMVSHKWTPQEILKDFVKAPYFAPGQGYHYSNTNFILLGLVVEKITGQQIGDLYRQRFFDPLGLKETYFEGNAPPPPSAAFGYVASASGDVRAVTDGTDYRPTTSAATVAWTAGGIDASAHDIALWGDALYGGHVVSPQALDQMEQWTYYPATDETYGLGTRSRVIENERVFGHTGSIRGFDAAMWHFPQTDMTISVLTNLGHIEANPIVDALAAVAYPAAQGTGVARPSYWLSTGVAALRSASSPLAVTNAAQLQQVLDQQRTMLHIPGAGAAVIFPDGSIWKSGSGDGQMNPQALATAKTPFVVGSITKTFMTATIMQLAEEGKLSIDDALSKWLPDYPRAAQITLRELLGHTSGVYNYFEYPTYNQRVFKTDKGHYWTPQEILDNFVGDPYFAPGTGFHYSNTGFILLGLVIQSATGQSLGAVLKQRFFVPLGLRHTYFQGAAAPPSVSAKGYLYSSGTWHEWSDATNYRPTISAASVAWSAGGIVSSSRDIAKWAAALYGGHVVSGADLAQMEDYTYAPASKGTYGLGTWSRVDGNGVRTYGHTGSLRGFDASMWYYPGTRLTVVVLTNLGRVDVNPITDALAATALPSARAYRAARSSRD
jgi:D-alanyl-D-alanine carboxypeptidase